MADGGHDLDLGLAAACGVGDRVEGLALILGTPLSKKVQGPTVGAGIIMDGACIKGGCDHGLKLKLASGVRHPVAWPLNDLMGEDWNEAREVYVVHLCLWGRGVWRGGVIIGGCGLGHDAGDVFT